MTFLRIIGFLVASNLLLGLCMVFKPVRTSLRAWRSILPEVEPTS